MAPCAAMTIPALIASAGHRDSSMAHDRLLNSGLTRALTDLLADLADLVQKEMQLAKAEVTEKIASGLRASVWMVAAAVIGLIAALLMVEAAVFAIASFGLALHWSCLLAAAVLAAGAAAAFYHARSVVEEDFLPTRTAKQVTQDIKTAKEQLI
jgi:putative superfamily III holin-X